MGCWVFVALRIDPWGHIVIREYEKLFQYFGIKPFKEVLHLIDEPHIYMTRGIIIGHRDFDKFWELYRKGRRVAILTGFMPSGRFHIGHKMVMEQLVYYQRLGVDVYVVIADAEAYAVRRIPRHDVIRIGIEEYIANAIALGLDPEKTVFYFQTNQRPEYYRLIQMFSRKVTFNELEAIYGSIEPAKIMAALTQVADVTFLTHPSMGGYEAVLVPVGADQDPHLRLARDIVDRLSGELDLKPPASTYHRFMTGLDGSKMSSSRPESAIFLSDDIEEAKRKVFKALTGGRATAEEQRRLGGEPEKCVVFELFAYHLVRDNDELKRIYDECKSGKMLCGQCKKYAAKLLEEFLTKHQEKLKEAKEIAQQVAEKIKPEF